MFINHIAILFCILPQCFNLGFLRTYEPIRPKEHRHVYQEKPETRYFTISEEKLMWKDASMACKKKGLNLFFENHYTAYQKFTDFLHKFEYSNSVRLSELWIGGRKTENPVEYRWENGEYVDFYGWLSPTHNYLGECLEVRHTYRFGWDTADCEKLNKYVCVGEAHEELLKKDFPEQYQQPNVETHEGVRKMSTQAPTTTISSPEDYYYIVPNQPSLHLLDMYDYSEF